MTPTSASSPITLFTASAPASKTAPAGSGDAAPDTGLSGFELLLGTVQQLQEQLSADGAETAGESKKAGETDADSGNALPPLGTLLPSLATQTPPAEAAHGDDADGQKKSDEKDDEKKGAEAIVLGWLPGVVVVPASAAAAPAPGSDVAPQIAALAGDGGKNNRAAAATAGMANANANAGADNGASISAPAAAANVNPVAVKAATESDFDTLVKHFEEPAPVQSLSGIADSAGANSASRAYSNTANANASAATNSAAVSIPVGNSGWSDAVADKVMWFSANKISSAEIHLNPPDLGPLQVRVSTQHDQASIVFTSQHAAVRDALDQALPRLRDMMGSQGMHLLDVSVGGQNPQQQQQQQFARNNGGDRNGAFAGMFGDDSAESSNVNVTTVNTARLLRSGVDAYA